MPVIAARELQDPVAAGEGPRNPDRAHRRLGAGGDEPDTLDRRHCVHDLLGEENLPLSGRAEGGAPSRGLPYGVHDPRLCVAEHERPPGHHPVDVPVAVDVLDPGALAARHEERLVDSDGGHGADRRVDPAWDHGAGAVEERGR